MLRVPFEQQDGCIVPQLVALVVEDGVDEQPQHLGWALSGGGGADDEVSEPVEAELRTVRVARLHDTVGVEQDAIARFQGRLVDLPGSRGEVASQADRRLRGLSSAWASTRSARISSGGGGRN